MPGPQPTAHQVLVYSGPGVSPLSLSYTLLTLSLLLTPHYTVQPVTPDVLSKQPWEQACALLVIPGGRDLPYVEELTTKTRVTTRIKEYVLEGGRYLGICAGAYFGAEEVRFDMGGGLEVTGCRDLAFVPGFCVGPTFPGFAYAAESGSRAVSLILGEGSSSQAVDHIYYNGGGHFVLPTPTHSDIEIIARYADSIPSAPQPIAAVLSRKGKGKALLCSVHAEYPLNDPPARDAIAKLSTGPDKTDIEESESRRIAWMEQLLVKLDLKPPGRRKDASNHGVVEGGEDPDVLLHPTHPSPIFIMSHPGILTLAPETFDAPVLRNKATSEGLVTVLRDGNDELRIGSVGNPESAKQQETLPLYLARRRREPPPVPPTLEDLTLDSSAPIPPPVPDFHGIPKQLLLPSASTPYSPTWTPLFNINTYWAELDAARKRVGRKSGVMRKDHLGGERAAVGDHLFYGETVTSTQTMLDRNPLLLTHLPTPIASLASFQLSGRGRGSNIWLSPPGCLQFSLLLTLPTSLSSKIVFIQYLMALAVCEAVDDDGRLGVKVKWPNDIYAECEGVGGTEVGSGKKGRAKLGGILVNTNFVNGQWRIVIGTGINVLNALPTTSISQLHSLLAGRSPEQALNPPTMEGTFAKIMNAFEIKWEQFVEDKGFDGFMDEYLGRWLHSNQEVTLTTTEPHTRLRILGITPDYGLLRCLPLSDDTSKRGPSGLTPLYSRGDFGGDDSSAASAASKKTEYIDLQPDGNSFDLMSGMIKRKQ